MDSPDWLPADCLTALDAISPILTEYGTAWLVVGAIARDYAFRNLPERSALRATMDLDLAICVSEWRTFSTIMEALCDLPGAKKESVHRLRVNGGLPLDIIPFGGVEDSNSQIAWPPEGDPSMNMLGFRDVFRHCHHVQLNSKLGINIANTPGIALSQDHGLQRSSQRASERPPGLGHASRELRGFDWRMGRSIQEAFALSGSS